MKSDFVYVGDESRDIEAAKAAEVKIISVTWGFNSREVLESANPGNIAENVDGVLNLAVENFDF